MENMQNVIKAYNKCQKYLVEMRLHKIMTMLDAFVAELMCSTAG